MEKFPAAVFNLGMKGCGFHDQNRTAQCNQVIRTASRVQIILNFRQQKADGRPPGQA